MLDRRQFLAGTAALAATAAATAAAPTVLPNRLAGAAVRRDLALLGDIYGRLHPGLNRYLPPGGFATLISNEMRGTTDQTPGEVYVMLARLTAAVRCGHSFPNPANQRGVVRRDLLGRADRLPFCTAWLDGRMVVTDALASGLRAGTIVDAIDGVSARHMLARMLPLTRADGSNDAKRVAQLELHRGDRFAAFDVLRPLLWPGRGDGTVTLSIRDPEGRTRTLDLPTAAEGARGHAAAEDPQYGWRFAIDRDGVGVLTMPDWSLYNSKWDWRGFLNEVADRLIAERARGLIVDVRENEGGVDCGDVLLARLIERPIAAVPGRRLVRFRETPPAWRPFLDTWDDSFHNLGRDAAVAADRPGYFALDEARGDTLLPTGRRFAGPVAVLIGPTCSSATFQFAQMVRRAQAGRLVGAATGGNRRGINGGCYFFVRLPETGLEVDLPLIGYFPETREPDAGIMPDVFAPPTRAALIAGLDPGLVAARKVVLG